VDCCDYDDLISNSIKGSKRWTNQIIVSNITYFLLVNNFYTQLTIKKCVLFVGRIRLINQQNNGMELKVKRVEMY